VRNVLFNDIITLSSDDPRLESIKESTLNFEKLFPHILAESQYLAEMNFTQHGKMESLGAQNLWISFFQQTL
jgi:hypothetical protein